MSSEVSAWHRRNVMCVSYDHISLMMEKKGKIVNKIQHVIASNMTYIVTTLFFLFFIYLFFVFCPCRATPTAYGGSQSRVLIRAVAAGLCQSHGNARSEACP